MVELGLINSSKVNSKQANYGSMKTGTQKKLEEYKLLARKHYCINIADNVP